MNNPTSKKTIAVICVVALIGIGAWLYLWSITEEYERKGKEKDSSIETLRKDWARATNGNLQYRQQFEELQDSIMMLNVRKGQVEIELNRKTEELRQANARYKNSRQVKDTAKALSICDSIVYTHIPEYLDLDSASDMYGNSVVGITTRGLANQYGIIDSQFAIIDTTYRAWIVEKTEEKKQDKKESRHRKGELIKVGIFGAAIGVLLALIFGG